MITRTRNKSISRTVDTYTRALDEDIYSLTDLHPILKTTHINIVAQIKELNYARGIM